MHLPPVPFYQDFLKNELSRRCERNKGYSLRSFARSLTIDAAALSKILGGKKIPSSTLTQKFLDRLELDPTEKTAFLTSIAQAQSQGRKRISPFFRDSAVQLWSSDVQTKPGRELTAQHFRVISDWYHFAILEMTFIKGFRPDAKYIARTLGISEMEAKFALERLYDLELLEHRGRKIVKADNHLTTLDKTVTTSAHRRRQQQVLEKSMLALQNDPIETRSHTGMTMAIDPRKIPIAKKMISNFNRQLSEFLESGNRREVYELSISLFSLQKEKKS